MPVKAVKTSSRGREYVATPARGQQRPPRVAQMRVADILALCPRAADVMAAYGLHCFSCHFSTFETLEQGIVGHGMDEEDLRNIVDDIHELLASQPQRPASLTIKAEAARAIAGIAKREKKQGQGLLVTTDERGGFCMEFRTSPADGDRTFPCDEVPGVRIFASPLTLSRIGGATIDYREGRFKLDLAQGCGCASGCSCMS